MKSTQSHNYMNPKTLLPLILVSALTSATLRADDAALLDIFEKRCAECHREDDEPTLHAGINLVSLHATEDAAEGILNRVSRAEEARGRMPKSKGKPGDPGYKAPLTAEEIAVIAAWVKNGSAPVPAPTPPASPASPDKPATTDTTAPAKPVAPTPTKEEAKPAPRTFLTMREEIALIAKDIESVESSRQPFVRYLTLSNLANARDSKGELLESEGQLEVYRAALGKLLNSVSSGGRIVAPVAVNENKTIYRLDLRDYGWSRDDWESIIVTGYPYGLRGMVAQDEGDIEKLSGSKSAWMRADWFVFAVSQPPFYHDLLRLPKTEQELEKQQQVDTLANLRDDRALRAGFRLSGVSQGNRLIERHEAGTGMYWKSYDFTPLVITGGHDLFRSPLGPVGAGLTKNKDREFIHDGGEVIFELANGLHGYYLATADGKRIDRGPTEIVQDKKRRDGAIINGISCMACHDRGMKYAREEPIESFLDEVGPVALAAGLDREEVKSVEALYQSKEALHAVILADETEYLAALAQATPGFDQPIDPVSRLYNRFKQDIRLENLAAEFGEEDVTFVERLKDSNDPDLESIAAQFEAGLGFPRSSWLDQFSKIAGALGYHLLDFTPVKYAEFTSGAPAAGGNEGKVTLSDGGKMTIATDKESYKKGELLTVKLRLTEGAYVRLYHLSADKELQQIFPNSAQSDNYVEGGKELSFGVQKEGTLAKGEFRFRMKEPFGTEIILAVASPVQFSDKENLTFGAGEVFKSFAETDLKEATRRGTKGLEVETSDVAGNTTGFRSAPTFTTRAVFTVGP
jgi:mono/diheme cytochrome c family protein